MATPFPHTDTELVEYQTFPFHAPDEPSLALPREWGYFLPHKIEIDFKNLEDCIVTYIQPYLDQDILWDAMRLISTGSLSHK